MPPRQVLSPRWKSIVSKWGPPDWASYASRCLNTLLQNHHVCSTREMEARLADFCIKLNPRAEPHHLTAARHTLKLQIVSSSPVPLYALPQVPLDSIRHTIARKQELNQAFVDFTRSDLCGDVAQEVIFTSMINSPNLSLEPHQLGKVSQIGIYTTTNPLDTYALLPFLDSSGTYQLAVIGIEVKNIREWIYPDSVEIWKALKACLDLHCIPIIISRTFHYTSFYFFRSIGVLGSETQKQYFAYDLRKDPVFQSVKDELYFRDMIPWKVTKKGIKPDPNVVKFFSSTLPRMIERTSHQFELNKPLLLHYATGPLHREETPISDRSALMKEFRDAFKQFHSVSDTGW